MPYFHVWFSTKRRKWLLQGDILDAVREALRATASEKGIRLMESEAVVDHVHLLLLLDDPSDLPRTMMLLKGVSARRIFSQFPELKLDARTQSLWEAGYGSKPIPEAAIPALREYIATQWERLENYDQPHLPPGPGRRNRVRPQSRKSF